MLGLSTQVSVARSLSHRSLFSEAVPVNQLLYLVAKYEIKTKQNDAEDEYLQAALNREVYLTIDGERKKVENPILLLAYAIMKKNPAILAKESDITDDSGRTFHGTVVKYVCRSSNFVMQGLISQHIPGGAEKIAKEMTAIEEETKNYDVVLMPTLPPGTTPADIKYNRLI